MGIGEIHTVPKEKHLPAKNPSTVVTIAMAAHLLTCAAIAWTDMRLEATMVSVGPVMI